MDRMYCTRTRTCKHNHTHTLSGLTYATLRTCVRALPVSTSLVCSISTTCHAAPPSQQDPRASSLPLSTSSHCRHAASARYSTPACQQLGISLRRAPGHTSRPPAGEARLAVSRLMARKNHMGPHSELSLVASSVVTTFHPQ